MTLPYELAIALRYVRSRNKNRFVSFISLMSMAGIAIAVMVLIVVLSVMNGFESEVRNRILQVVSHGIVTGIDGPIADWRQLSAIAEANPAVAGAAPYVEGQAMIVGKQGIRGVQLRGIDPILEERTSSVGRLLTAGELSDLEEGQFGIVLGRRLAEELGADVGDRVMVMVSQGITTPAGLVPRMRRFVVKGIFDAGMYEYDRALALVNLNDAQRLLRLGPAVSGVQVAMKDPLTAPVVVREVAMSYGGGMVSDWTLQHANFFRSIQLTRSIIFVILLLVVAVAAFNIVSTLVMVVRDKRSEIAILRTLGSAPRSIMALFVFQGAIVGLVGTLTGVVLGVLGAWNISAITAAIERLSGVTFLAADVYFISELPSRLLWSDVIQIAGIALLLSLASTLYPAWRGAVTAPAEVLRYE